MAGVASDNPARQTKPASATERERSPTIVAAEAAVKSLTVQGSWPCHTHQIWTLPVLDRRYN